MEAMQRMPQKSHAGVLLIIFAVLLAAAALAYRYAYAPKYGTPSVKPQAPQTAMTTNPPASDLGSELYNNAANPIKNKLPSTIAPVPNPLGNIYKNPFQ